MALIFPGRTECSLCGAVIEEGNSIVATAYFIADQNDALWRFSDSAMHKPCFLKWEHREQFVTRYNKFIGTYTFGNGTYHHMEDDGTIVIRKRDAEILSSGG